MAGSWDTYCPWSRRCTLQLYAHADSSGTSYRMFSRAGTRSLLLHPQRFRWSLARSRDALCTQANVDYAASPADEGVLQMPLKQELDPSDMVNVFGYPRDLRKKCAEERPLSFLREILY